MRRFINGDKGFTLIEVLVVVAILGVLTAIAIPSVASFIGRGMDEAAALERNNVQVAVMAAMAEVPIGDLNDGGTLGAPDINTVTYGTNSTTLSVETYIVGGLESLEYMYFVDDEGTVAATTGPLS